MPDKSLKRFVSGALRALAWFSTAAALATSACSDQSPAGPRGAAAGHSRLAIAPRFQAVPAGAPTVPLSKIRGALIGGGDSTVVTANFVGDSAVLTFDVQFQGASATFTLDLTAFDDQGIIAFRSTQTVTLRPGDNNAITAPMLVYAAPDAGLTKLRVAPAAVTLNAGAAAMLSASGTTASGQAITPLRLGWTSRNPAVATVDANGGVRAGQFQGTTYVVARTVLDVADSALISVHAPVDKIVVAPATLEVVRGLTGAIGAELRDAGGHLIDDRAATFTSSDASVATVSSLGVVTGLKLGTTTITASAEGKSATAAVTVVTPIDRIELTPAALSFASLRETQTVTARVVPKTGASVAGIVPQFSSSNPAVAAVDASGKVSAVGNGSASITASADGVQATTSATVRQIAVSIAISPKTAGITFLNDRRTFVASASDALGSPLAASQITFTSVDPTIVSITQDGVAVGHKNGTTSIVATAGSKSDTATFTVAQIPTFIAVTADRTQIQVGQTAQLTGRVADAGGSPIGTGTATWTAQTPTIASVTASGLVTGLQPGVARFTAAFGGLTGAISIIITPGPNQGTGAVTGQILNGAIGAPISGATVTSSGGQTTTTAADGSFLLNGVTTGATLQIAAQGFVSTQYFGVQIAGQSTPLGAIPLAPQSTSSGSFFGGVVDAVSGTGISSATLTVRAGANATTGAIVLQTTTDVEGAYNGSLPAGTYTVTASAPGYTTATGTFSSIGNTQVGNADIALSPSGLTSTEYRFVLQWGPTPPDLDLHLIGPAGDSTFEVWYGNTTFSNAQGVVAQLDHDATDGFGPETITLLQTLSGTYRVYVHKFCCGESFATSNARLAVYRGSTLVNVYNVPSTDGVLWSVLELDGATGIVTGINTISPTCTASVTCGEASANRIPNVSGRMSDVQRILSETRTHPKKHAATRPRAAPKTTPKTTPKRD